MAAPKKTTTMFFWDSFCDASFAKHSQLKNQLPAADLWMCRTRDVQSQEVSSTRELPEGARIFASL